MTEKSQTGHQVTLRAIEPEDLDLLYKVENDRELWDVSVTNVPYSRYVLYNFLNESTGDIYIDKQVRLICENECGETVGIVDLVNFEPRHLRAEVGIVIQKNHRGKGYARLALDELMVYARRVIHLHQLYAVVAAGNQQSVALFQQLGFQSNGVLKDWLFDGKDYQDAILMQYFL